MVNSKTMRARALIFAGLYRLVIEIIIRLFIIVMIIALGLYWGKLFEALLVLVAIFQFELAYRQYWFSKVRDEPTFAVFASEHRNNSIFVEVRNVGLTPAYNVGVSRIICRGIPVKPEEWTKYVRASRHPCLAPLSSGTLAIIDKCFYEKHFIRESCVLEVSYFNKFGEWKNFMIGFHELTPIIITGKEKSPGFLLSLGDYIALLRALIALRKLK